MASPAIPPLTRFLLGFVPQPSLLLAATRNSGVWRLAQTLAALYPKHADEKRWVEGALASRMDQDEQEIARTLALRGPLPRTALFPDTADVGRRRQVQDALQNLIDTTVLIEQPDGRIAHRYGLLQRVVQQEAKELGFE